MKDFIKWLGVNEKVAKVVVWLLIIMVCLIVVNACLQSIGFSHYAITYDNLVKIDVNLTVNIIFSCIVCILNFYATTLLIFRVKESKSLLKYAFLYMTLNWIVKEIFGYGVLQIFIALFYMIFCYFYSKKKKKYILYGMLSLVLNTIIQGVWYTTKVQLIDYTSINGTTKTLLTIDYFIIMAVIILVKEIYLKKRGEKIKCGKDLDAGYGSENSKMKANSQRK